MKFLVIVFLLSISSSIFANFTLERNGKFYYCSEDENRQCTPQIKCSDCNYVSQRTCKIINCEGIMTETYVERCEPKISWICHNYCSSYRGASYMRQKVIAGNVSNDQLKIGPFNSVDQCRDALQDDPLCQ